MSLYYKDKDDLVDQKFSQDRGDDRGDRRSRDRDGGRGRDRDRGDRRDSGSGNRFRDASRDGGSRDSRDRDGGNREFRDKKPRRNNEDMVRFFFNLGKRDNLKKMDMLEIINKSTEKSRKRPDIGNIEILEKFSFFEVEKSFRDEVIKGLQTQKLKGKDMRAEVAQ